MPMSICSSDWSPERTIEVASWALLVANLAVFWSSRQLARASGRPKIRHALRVLLPISLWRDEDVKPKKLVEARISALFLALAYVVAIASAIMFVMNAPAAFRTSAVPNTSHNQPMQSDDSWSRPSHAAPTSTLRASPSA